MSAQVPSGGASPVPEPQGPAGTALRPVDDLLARLTPAERISLLHQHAPAVPRLGLAAFRTGTEALHGVAWLGRATVFPQAVGLGATWDPELVERVGEAVGRELRARHRDDPRIGLLVWAPVVNLLRDPRWGRNEEGYSEDVLHGHRGRRHAEAWLVPIPTTCGSPPAQALPGPQQRDRSLHHLQQRPSRVPARVRPPGVPGPAAGRGGRRGDAGLQPGERTPGTTSARCWFLLRDQACRHRSGARGLFRTLGRPRTWSSRSTSPTTTR